MKLLSLATVLLAQWTVNRVQALDNGLATTPPMGWLSWERYMCNTDCKGSPDSCISEDLYKRIADELVTGGYRDAGYVYVRDTSLFFVIHADTRTHIHTHT